MRKRKVGRPSNKQLRRERNLKLLGILSIFIVAGFLFYGFTNVFNINKLKADVTGTSGAIFDTGGTVNAKMKQLTGNENAATNTVDEYITNIKRSSTLSINPTDANKVSTSDSEVPIYMWYDNGIIYWYTTDPKPKLNPISDSFFSDLTKLESIDELNEFDTSNVTHMIAMFQNCKKLNSLDLSSFDTTKLTYMMYMFEGCSSLTTINLSNFNTSKVTNMNKVFAGCSSLTTLNLSSFNTNNVTDMVQMFMGCVSLKTLNISSFNTSKVTDMFAMFYGCHSLTSLDLSNFNTVNVTDMEAMFGECVNLKTIYVSNKFVTNNVIDFSDMFENCISLVGQKGTIYNSNHIDKEYAKIDGGTSDPGYFTLNGGSDSSGDSSDEPSGGSDSFDENSSSTNNNTQNNANECKMILSSSVYTIDNNKLTINNVDKNHSVETIRSNITSDCGTIMVNENKVILSTNKDLKEYTINRMWMPQTGQKVIKYTVIIAGIIAIITGLLIYKKKNDK